MPETPRAHRRGWFASAVAGVTCGLAVFAVTGAAGVLSATPAQAAGSTSSAVTVTAKGQDLDYSTAPFPKLEVTVSQTQDLSPQGVTVSWIGGAKSTPPSSQTGGANFLQVFQCWGDLLDGNGLPILDQNGNRQPDRTTCQYGGFNTPGAAREGVREPGTIAHEDLTYTANADGEDPFVSPLTSIPFRSPNGKVIAPVVDGKLVPGSPSLSNNEFYTSKTTNEISWAGSGADGSGAAKFELQTAMQSTGLSCGLAITDSVGKTIGSSCWLVIVPRPLTDVGQQHITSSGLFWDSWKHRLAVPLGFKPIGVRCAIGAAERQLAGSELVAFAVRSWQPTLCNDQGGSAYSLLTGSESDALRAANTTDDAALALASYPLDPDAGSGLAYAPVALTGVTVGFAVDQNPLPIAGVPDDVANKAALPFTALKLTPRLVAKLLTSSYRDSLPYGADISHIGYKNPSDPGHNALNLTTDPEFLSINDESWKYQGYRSPGVADLLVPQGRGDAARAVWDYVLADPDARAFLEGEPDKWGMVVNPWYSTNDSVNRTNTGLTLPREDFPKADPVEVPGAVGGAGPVNLVTWRPYTNDLEMGAYLTLRGDSQQLGSWDSVSIPAKYTKAGRDLPGSQKVLSLTDSSSSDHYQVLTAQLRNPAGDFVAPTVASFLAAANAMTPIAGVETALRFDQESASARSAHDAYPLTVPVYAAANPAKLDASNRSAYAMFVRYVSGSGQMPGAEDGQLPAGYAPIPKSWADQSLAAADVIEHGRPAAVGPSGTGTGTTAYIPSQTSPSATTHSAANALAAPPVAAPSATGSPSAALSGGTTPGDSDIGPIAAAVPASALAGVAGAAAVPLITRLRRRVL